MTRPLTAKARAFADAYNGPGSGSAAARAAGYSGGDHALRVRASELLKDARVRQHITKRLGPGALEQPEVGGAGVTPPPPVTGVLRKGVGRGTATERIELAMAIARSKDLDPKARIQALRLGAELEGELRTATTGRQRPIAPADASLRPAPAAPAPGLRLVLNPADEERSRG
jgi:hypothetical protein